MTKCSVVIPYFQREPGILRRALASVFAQSHGNFDIIVVDDASPSPVAVELEGLDASQRSLVRVIAQPNGGPGAARNTGLEAVSDDVRFVAFLDSDDEWRPDHLKIAVECLSLFDADCYFGSIAGGDAFYYHFGVADLAEKENVIRLSETPPVVELPDLASVMLRDWSFMHLSAMVIGPSLFRQIRFEASLRLAAEDVLFFYECVRGARRTVLSEEVGAVRGEGVNIFHGLDSASPLFLSQQFNTLVALDRLGSGFAHAPEDRASIEGYKQTARRQALWGQARLVRERRAPQWRGLARWAWRDPRIMASAVDLAFSKLFKQAASR
jgi:succinoglycan biosynthesis protein ExoW